MLFRSRGEIAGRREGGGGERAEGGGGERERTGEIAGRTDSRMGRFSR